MDYHPIPPSYSDLERRRLETTLDQDLGSLSLGSLVTSSSSTSSNHPYATHLVHHHSFVSSSSSLASELEYPRALDGDSMSFGQNHHHRHPFNEQKDELLSYNDEADTPRPSRKTSDCRKLSNPDQSLFIGASPTSTAGHHASAMTLGAGVFRKPAGTNQDTEGEFDPERSLGRLVGELGKVVGERISPRPLSPFSANLSPPQSPRSPSPLAPYNQDRHPSLTYSLSQNDPLPSPPTSRSSSGNGPAETRNGKNKISAIKSISKHADAAEEIGQNNEENPARYPGRAGRKVLGEVTTDNLQTPMVPQRASGTRDKESDRNRFRRLKENGHPQRPASAPTGGRGHDSVDITGLTGLLDTPAKGGRFGIIDKNERVGGDSGASIPQALASLHARLRALETENSVSRRRVKELEAEVERARKEVEQARKGGESRLREAIGEKTALEELVKSLRKNLTRITIELEQSRNQLHNLQTATSPPRASHSSHASEPVARELSELRREVERLSREIEKLGGIVQEGLGARRRSRQRDGSLEHDEEDFDRVKKDVERREKERQEREKLDKLPSKLTQGLHTSALPNPALAPPSAAPPSRILSRPRIPSQAPDIASFSDDAGNASPSSSSSSSRRRRTAKAKSFLGDDHRAADQVVDAEDGSAFPSIRGEELEKLFFGASDGVKANDDVRKRKTSDTAPKRTTFTSVRNLLEGDSGDVPPQTVLARVLRELEDDFVHYKAIYVELADQYKILDAASHVAKRHVLAEHLQEVIGTLEQKADQIAALYDLLVLQDRPNPSTHARPDRVQGTKSVKELLRNVRESLSEDALRRLENEGLGFGQRGKNVRMGHGIV